MKIQYAIKAAAAAALLTSVAAHATESVVFVDDDPASGGSSVDAQTFYFPNAAAWTQSTFFPQTYGQGYHFSRSAGSIRMRALLDIDESGGGADNTSGSQFQAFARWSAGNNRCNAVNIQVYNATTGAFVTSEIVNQITQGRQFNWVPIGGRFTATPNQLYEIRVNSPGVCVTTADGGMFVQQTYDSSDVFNLTSFSTIDEAGIDYDESPPSRAVTAITTCATRTTLAQVTMSIPDSVSTKYIHCIANGRTFHSQTGKWVFYALDDALGNGNDEFSYTGVATTTSTYNNYDPYTIQQVYPVSSEGGVFNFYLKACRQDTATTGTSYHDLVCAVYPTRY